MTQYAAKTETPPQSKRSNIGFSKNKQEENHPDHSEWFVVAQDGFEPSTCRV